MFQEYKIIPNESNVVKKKAVSLINVSSQNCSIGTVEWTRLLPL